MVYTMSRAVERVKSMIEVESRHASSLSESVEGLRNPVVQEVLRGIAHDSRKHAGFYMAILAVLRGESPALTEEDYNRIGEVIRRHIEAERRMIEEAKGILEAEEDPRIRHLMMEIYGDEVKHHTLMKRILDAVIRRETIFEREVWDMLWRDVPGHGAPIPG